MGVLTVFVIAAPGEAERVGKAHYPLHEFGGLDAKGIDQVMLATLYAILTGEAYDPAFMAAEESVLFAGSDDGPWVQVVPDDLTARVASLGRGAIARVSDAWSRTEEFSSKYFTWSRADVEDFLTEFASLCRRAVTEHKSVLMWNCL